MRRSFQFSKISRVEWNVGIWYSFHYLFGRVLGLLYQRVLFSDKAKQTARWMNWLWSVSMPHINLLELFKVAHGFRYQWKHVEYKMSSMNISSAVGFFFIALVVFFLLLLLLQHSELTSSTFAVTWFLSHCENNIW